jgi:hypothetical protein
MAISKKKRQGIENDAQKMSTKLESASEAEVFKEDYIDIMTELNESLENRLEDFRSAAIPVLREAYQARPSGILSVISQETEAIRDLAQIILQSMEKVKYTGFRMLAAECVKDIVDICTDTITESDKRATLRHKVLEQ